VAVAGGWGAVPARAAARCSYSGPPDNLLSIKADGGAYSYIAREGDAIVVGEYEKPASQCAGGVPTVFNTDTIRLVYSGTFLSDVDILLRGGPFAPGGTPEGEGASEIEIELSGEVHASVLGTSQTDEFHWGPGGPYHAGLNLNPRDSGDRDVDVTLQTKLGFASLVAKGLGGDDTIIPTPGTTLSRTNASIWSQGWGGDDYLVAPRNGGSILEGLGGDDVLIGGRLGDDLNGGRGNDRLVGGAGPDRIDVFGGNARGRDLILAGPGRDQINSRDSDRDQVRCGPGRDLVRADDHDRLRGCEVIRRHGPVWWPVGATLDGLGGGLRE
jgi:Ca2+-binding RTX toxin-like protein